MGPVGDGSEIVPWPGGCRHVYHAECIARMYHHANNEQIRCPQGYVTAHGMRSPTPCLHGTYNICYAGCKERCFHDLWTGLTGCRQCTAFAVELPTDGRDVDPEGERKARELTDVLGRELQRVAHTEWRQDTDGAMTSLPTF